MANIRVTSFGSHTAKLKKGRLRIAALLCLTFLIFSSISVMSASACKPPVAYFSYSPYEPVVNQVITFNASASYDPDGRIISYEWNFGDGTTGSGMIVNHTYTTFGSYIVTLEVTDIHCLKSDYTVIVSVSKPTLNVQTYVGSMHFAGEIAEFYVLVGRSGKPVNATVTALLYYSGVLYDNLSAPVEYAAQGFYRIPYEIPLEASEGAYVLVVEAACCGLQEIALEGFLVSPTLTGWNARLVNIQDSIAIIKTDVSTIKISLDAINASLVSIEGDIATIETNIGEIKADIKTINATLTMIEGNIALISSDLGKIKVNVHEINASITDIHGRLVTIETTLGDIIINLDQINAAISSFEGSLVKIETDLGTIKTTLDSINLTVTKIDGKNVTISTTLGEIEGTLESILGDLAIIKTKLGEIEARLPSTQPTPLGVSLGAIFSAIAAVASIIVAVLLLIRRKKPTVL